MRARQAGRRICECRARDVPLPGERPASSSTWPATTRSRATIRLSKRCSVSAAAFIDNNYSNNYVYKKYGIKYTIDDRFVTGDPFTNYAGFNDVVNGKSYNTDQDIDSWEPRRVSTSKITDKINLTGLLAYRTYETNWMSDSDLTPFGLIRDRLIFSSTYNAELRCA